jgi:hypothetical protein
MAPEQLLFFALFLVVALANLIARWIAARAERRRRAEAKDRGEIARQLRRPPRRREAPPPEPAWIPPPPRPVTAEPARRAPARRRRVRLGAAPDLRRAIVLMTVLGPPRALEPPGESRP